MLAHSCAPRMPRALRDQRRLPQLEQEGSQHRRKRNQQLRMRTRARMEWTNTARRRRRRPAGSLLPCVSDALSGARVLHVGDVRSGLTALAAGQSSLRPPQPWSELGFLAAGAFCALLSLPSRARTVVGGADRALMLNRNGLWEDWGGEGVFRQQAASGQDAVVLRARVREDRHEPADRAHGLECERAVLVAMVMAAGIV
eukprot:663646-Rhodomonas_salina.2